LPGPEVREHDPKMRSKVIRLYLIPLFLLLVGLTGLYLGYFHAGTSCVQSVTTESTCTVHAAGTIDPLPTIVGAVFVLVAVYSFFRFRRSENVRGAVRDETRGLGSVLQARLASDMRAYYTKHYRGSPSEFDRQMLSLFDSIEAGATDIDAKIETLRSYVQKEGLFQRWKHQYRANIVWRTGDESLQWVPETWLLRTSWARLRIVGPTWASYTMAPAWGAPASTTARASDSAGTITPD
jgi:hypothetical protein